MVKRIHLLDPYKKEAKVRTFVKLIGLIAILISSNLLANSIEDALEQQALVNTILKEDWQGMLNKTAALRKRGLDLGTEILFFEGRAYSELGNSSAAEKKLTTYVNKAGSKGANYSAALNMLNTYRQQQQMTQQKIAAQKAADNALRSWQSSSLAGEVISVNSNWGFFTLKLSKSEDQSKPLQVMTGNGIFKVGTLKALDDGSYSATADKLPAAGDKIYRCCAP